MNIIAFIPSRYGSKRFPGKPLGMILGKPMIQHVYERALMCSSLSDVYVATDDERIFRAVEKFGGKVLMTGKEHSTGSDRVAEAAKAVGVKDNDLVINIQGDQPVFNPLVLEQLINPFFSEKDTLMSTLKYRIHNESELNDPNHVKVVTDRMGFAIFFSRSPIPHFRDPGAQKIYYKHLGFYAYRMDFLQKFASLPRGTLEMAEKLEQLRVIEHGYRIKVVETDYDSLEVDRPEDIKRVEKLLRSQT